jgi:hypothetical protein
MASSNSRYLPSRNTQYDCETVPTQHLLTAHQTKVRRTDKIGQRTARSGRFNRYYGSVRVRGLFHQSCTLEMELVQLSGGDRDKVQMVHYTPKTSRIVVCWSIGVSLFTFHLVEIDTLQIG